MVFPLVAIPSRQMSERCITIGTFVRQFSSVPQLVTLERMFGHKLVTTLAALQFGSQMRPNQMHCERAKDVETLLAQIALKAPRVFMLQ
jgi:hypothetical protein